MNGKFDAEPYLGSSWKLRIRIFGMDIRTYVRTYVRMYVYIYR